MHLKIQANFIVNGRWSLNTNVSKKSDNTEKENTVDDICNHIIYIYRLNIIILN